MVPINLTEVVRKVQCGVDRFDQKFRLYIKEGNERLNITCATNACKDDLHFANLNPMNRPFPSYAGLEETSPFPLDICIHRHPKLKYFLCDRCIV